MDYPNLLQALNYCRSKGLDIPPELASDLRALGVEPLTDVTRAVGDYEGTRSQYVNDIENAMINYLMGDKGMASSKGEFKRSTSTSFVDAFETGYTETAGGTYEPEPEDSEWLAQRQAQELGYIDGLYVAMKEMKSATGDEALSNADILDFAETRAAGYARTLDGVYSQGKLRGKKNIMLTLDGPDGKESCPECQRLKGQRHRSKWWVARDLVPGPGNINYSCNGYNCQHQLFDDAGTVWAGSEWRASKSWKRFTRRSRNCTTQNTLSVSARRLGRRSRRQKINSRKSKGG
jgi:hypothetical protein